MKTHLLLVSAFFFGVSALCQTPKFEIKEFKGEVIKVEPGQQFAFSRLVYKVGSDTLFARFNPHNGEWLLNYFQAGSFLEIRVKQNGNQLSKEARKQKWFTYYWADEVLAVKKKNEWVSLNNLIPDKKDFFYKVFLEKKVRGEVFADGFRSGLVFDNGLIGWCGFNTTGQYPMKNIKPGDMVSFVGHNLPKGPGYVYPIAPVNNVFWFNELIKLEGTVSAFLYKQNFVCIGFVVQSSLGQKRLSFPSDMAQQVKQFTDQHTNVVAYYNEFKIDNQLNPQELHALVSGSDTLAIEQFGFYGGEDVKHDHQDVVVEGKISAIHKSDRGKIISLIIGKECFVEVDAQMANQLSSYLKKGNLMKITGKERVKKEGEIYSKNFRIIVPQKILIDQKEFEINPQF